MDTETFLEELYPIMAEYIIDGKRRCEIYEIGLENQSRPSDEKGKISYLKSDKRVRLTVRRYLTRILKLKELTEKQLTELADKINEMIGAFDNYTIEILKGQDIQEAYRNRMGGRSCMTGDCCDYVGLYRDNPRRIRLAVLRHAKNSARCIIWYGDDKELYFDRIYSDYRRTQGLLSEVLEEKGLMDIYNNGSHNVSVSGLSYNNDEIPYMDSLQYGTINEDKLDLSNKSGDITLDGTDGQLMEYEYHCVDCNCGIEYEGGASTVSGGDIVCESCYNNNYSYCEYCDEAYDINNTEFYEIHDIFYCEHCISDVATKCEHCNTYMKKEDIHHIDDHDVCNDCLGEHYQVCEICEDICSNDDFPESGICCNCIDDYKPCIECDAIVERDSMMDNKCVNCNGIFAKV